MKLIFGLILLINFTAIAGQSNLQKSKLSLKMENASLADILYEIEDLSNVGLFFRSDLFSKDDLKSVDFENASLNLVLNEILQGNYSFQLLDENIIITEKEKEALPQQERTVSGTITDESGDPLPGVSVVVKDAGNGAVTDLMGKYNLSIPLGSNTLIFSFIGMKTVEVDIGDRNVIDIQMESENIGLEEVVAIGYGSRKKESLTGAISNITERDIVTTTHSSLAQNLQGKIPGLQIRQYTGEPGDFSTLINIRGFGSPLFVIDGIARDGGTDFQKLNPEDIESISVLKDASAAIYGLNAANGVIIVTTKKGSSGKVKFNYGAVVGFQSPTNIPKMATAAQYMEMRNDANVVIGDSPYLPNDELLKYQQGLLGYENTDWYSETMKNSAMFHQHNFSAQGGNDFVSYFLSFGYLKEDGLLKSNDLNYDKYNFRSNISTILAKNLVADVSLSGRFDTKNAPGQVYEDILKGSRVSLPTDQVYANNNTDYYSIVAPTNLNPVAYSDRDYTGYIEDKTKFFQSSISLTYKPEAIKGLEIKGLASYDTNLSGQKNLHKSYKLYTYDEVNDYYIGADQRLPSRISNSINDYNRVTLQAHLNYNKTIAENHNFGATLVYEQRHIWSRYSYLEREYEFYTNDQINQASVNNQITRGTESDIASMSYLGRLTYDFKGKYLIDYAARYDGSYRYHPDRRWGFFPVISAGWRISQESFIKDNLPIISNMKIRASYGKIGQDVGVPFQYVPGFSTVGGGGYEFYDGVYTTGSSSPSIINPYLTWAESVISDIGLDMGFFKGKLMIEADVYQRDRSGLLAIKDVSLPNTFGGTLPQENLNSDLVRGFEFLIAHKNKIGDLSYSVQGNLNFARTMNKYVERAPYSSSYDKWRNGNSDRWNDIVWAYVLDGQFQTMDEVTFSPPQNGNAGNTKELPGDFKYVDVNEDGIIDANDMKPIFWGGDPKLYYGFTLSATWKGFDMHAIMQGSGKNSMRFWGGGSYGEMFAFGGNLPEYFYDRWHPADPYDANSEWVSGEWPATRTKYDVGAMYLESGAWRNDASYLRMKSLEFGYTFKSPLLTTAGITNLRIYSNAHNLFTICDPRAKIFDPEKQGGVGGVIGLAYPVTRSFNFGININF